MKRLLSSDFQTLIFRENLKGWDVVIFFLKSQFETVKSFICLFWKISNVGWHSSFVNTAKVKIKCSSGN